MTYLADSDLQPHTSMFVTRRERVNKLIIIKIRLYDFVNTNQSRAVIPIRITRLLSNTCLMLSAKSDDLYKSN